ncbi:MAG: DUF2076 domain-containing protein [Alphaproteobacteria bacterium]|nr:DUF2076 domain-containing protein [Alphaproteobacteria bacterium]MBU0799329.1 DUF2076 domain-containing protein [Alphaproteobacteria bacterium]MBU0888157.1 DUF2076 domain-containing protein [Alphaproteobacteria bacterium]MBU1811602.1 DUF2076 domain-containing protein [Alphaproteobacteria bacterium]
MDQDEHRIIDGLFVKLRQAEDQGGPRDSQAEAVIRDHLAAQPAAPYYMAQAVLVQEDALRRAAERIEALEGELRSRPAGGGFLAGLFGGAPAAGESRPGQTPHTTGMMDRYRNQPGTSSFLGGAMQTGMAVAGGLLLGNMLAGLFANPADAAQDEFSRADAGSEDPDMGGGDMDMDLF